MTATLTPPLAEHGKAETAAMHDRVADYGQLALLTVVGSHAYGTNHADSDVDLRGMYCADEDRLRGMLKAPETLERSAADTSVHEAAKLMAMAVAGQPGQLEVLYSPLVVFASPAGQVLLDRRHELLSQQMRLRYGGYARSQMKKVGEGRTSGELQPKRRDKHLLHCFRLLEQGRKVLETGELDVRVEDPDRLREQVAGADFDTVMATFKIGLAALEQVESPLPERVDRDVAHRLLLDVRDAVKGS